MLPPDDFAAEPGDSCPVAPGGLTAVAVPSDGSVLIVPFVVPEGVAVVEPDVAGGVVVVTLGGATPGVTMLGAVVSPG